MKRIFIWHILWLLLVGAVRAQDQTHFFIDTQGRAIEATITACDYSKNKVTLERAQDQRRVTVPINMFSRDDQAYIKEWYMSNELVSEKNLGINCRQQVLDRRKEEKVTDVTNSRGNYLGTDSQIKKYEKIGYEISLKNRGDLPLDKLRIEYRIYYEQSMQGLNPEPEQKVFRGSVDVPSLGKGEKVSVKTDSVEIYDEELSRDARISSSYTPVGGKGEVHGLRARIYLTLPGGKESMREFSEPSSLSEQRFTWE